MIILREEDAAIARAEEEKNDFGTGLILVLVKEAALLRSATIIFAEELAFLEEDARASATEDLPEDACAIMIADRLEEEGSLNKKSERELLER